MKTTHTQEIENYSPDFTFFLEHQVFVIITNNRKHYKFASRLNGELFKEIDGYETLNDQEIRENCKEIHTKLIN